MSSRRDFYAVEMQSRDGVRLECDVDGWRVLNIRQLGAGQRTAALALLARAEIAAPRDPQVPFDSATFLEGCERAAGKLRLRITHRRWKQIERR